MNNVEYGLIMQELERGDSGLRSFVSVQGALVMYPILTLVPKSRSSTGCRGCRAGEAIGCFGLTEPDFGSNPAGMRTTARRDGDCWVLNGEKTWITNGTRRRRRGGLGARRGGHPRLPGRNGHARFTTSDIHGKWSMRASVTSSLSFSDCRVPRVQLLPGAKGLKGPLCA